jgi:hypothetical protein
VTQPEPPRKHRRGSENRARSHQVAVRLSPAEHALLQAVAASSGKSAPSVLRDTFLASVETGITPGPPRPDLQANEVPGDAQ